MTPLADILASRIRASGPISIADYMAECLLHPQHGYYSSRHPFGGDGDFTTAPEISQMFGELLGLALVQVWLDQGSPDRIVLAEIGPGNGTLMADVLRATGQVPGFVAAAQVRLVEVSERLQAVQAETVRASGAEWVPQIGDLPDGPLFLLANEFFDALPIRQFVRDADGWRERLIAVRDGALAMVQSDAVTVPGLKQRLDDTNDGDVVEVCAAAGPVMAELASRIGARGGAAIIVDYGGWHSLGDTLQAVRNHEYDNPLAHPGQADITAHVDFEALVAHSTGVSATAMTHQGDLLKRLGIEERHAVLAKGLSGSALENHDAALKRLTDASEMGTLFKAIGLHPGNAPPPPGFDP